MERVQRVVDGLQGDLTDPLADTTVNGLHVEMVAAPHGLHDGQPGGGYPQPCLAKSDGVSHTHHASSLKLNDSSKGTLPVFSDETFAPCRCRSTSVGRRWHALEA
ncbi:hypothetical protein GCM10023194_44410 [Planotetraspora phitsanulokensis]